ncbi:MAG: EamA family transporter [Bacteroidetes bacterium HGW-Bacteroidetes-16]|jgi:drug/metabolite transporter (DMT)-like permease|nr:MAG: EamA family transporter [Bacteroidetes bacterium HGW-Bacteroidetes-16]
MNQIPGQGHFLNRNKLVVAHLAAIGANIIFGINYVVAKGIMPDYLAPRAVIFLRVTGAMAIFWAISLIMPKQAVAKHDLLKMFIAAIFGVAINQILFFEGLNLTTPINASVIMVGVPILVLFFAHFIIKERITKNKMIGIVLGFSGSVFLIIQAGNASFQGSQLGNLMVFTNAASYALFLVLIKPLMAKYHPLTVMKWVFTFGFVLVTPFTLHLVLIADFRIIPSNIWLSIGFVVLFTTVIAYFLNNFSLKVISPTVNSAYIYFQPFLATFVAISFGKDVLTWPEIVAALFIFTGVYFVNFNHSVNKKPAI